MLTRFSAWFDGLTPGARHLLNTILFTFLSMVISFVAIKLGVPAPPTPEIVIAQNDLPPSPAAKAFTGDTPPLVPQHSFGWVNDTDGRAASFKRLPPTEFKSTPAGKIALGDVPDTFLWEAVRKAAARPPPWYPNINQQDVGCCVGCGWKQAGDVCLAVQVVTKGGTWKPLSAEAIYGMSRVDIGGGQIRGDGSLGAWAREAVRSEGVAAMEAYGPDDLTQFSPRRARVWGNSGVPDAVKRAAAEHPIKATAIVNSWSDVQRSISQGYPIAVCSDVGFENPNGSPGTRDAQGFCKARGTWPHCMSFVGVRGGDRPGAFCLNNWGDTAHSGPVWPKDAPVAGFWVDSFIVDKMVKQGDSFSLADVAGFPARDLDWFTLAKPAGPDWAAVERHLAAGYPMVVPRHIGRHPAEPWPFDPEEFRAAKRHSLAW